MYIPISQQLDIPIYQQIVDAIKNAVLSGELQEGDPMPSTWGLPISVQSASGTLWNST